jgi:hypothetical protein
LSFDIEWLKWYPGIGGCGAGEAGADIGVDDVGLILLDSRIIIKSKLIMRIE